MEAVDGSKQRTATESTPLKGGGTSPPDLSKNLSSKKLLVAIITLLAVVVAVIAFVVVCLVWFHGPVGRSPSYSLVEYQVSQ